LGLGHGEATLDTTEMSGGESLPTRKKRPKVSRPKSIEKPNNPSGTLLVVEPDILARMSIAEYLRDCGYKVIEADSIEDALKVLRGDAKVDVVLAEVSHWGAADGFALSKQIHESHPSVDVILTSNVANCADKAGDLCDEGVLGKPYHPDELLRRIHILRERRRSAKLP
jgi:DNA-binding response OmpR family regulator